MIKAFPVIIDKQGPNLFRSIGIGLPWGNSILRGGGGGLDLTSSLEAKFGAKLSQIYQIKGKTWEVLSPQDAKFGKNPYFGVISEIQMAKFGVLVTYTFGGKIWGSNKNLGRKFWGQAGQAPRPPDIKVPLGLTYLL